MTRSTEEVDDKLMKMLKFRRGTPNLALLDSSEGIALEVFAYASHAVTLRVIAELAIARICKCAYQTEGEYKIFFQS